jgi:protein tyrosine phosphatase
MTYYLTCTFLKASEFTFTIHDIIQFALKDSLEHDIHYHSLAYLQAYFKVYPEACIVDSDIYGPTMQILSAISSDTKYIDVKKRIINKELPKSFVMKNEEPKIKDDDSLVYEKYLSVIQGTELPSPVDDNTMISVPTPDIITLLTSSIENTSELPTQSPVSEYVVLDEWATYRSIPDPDLMTGSTLTFPCNIYQYGVRIYLKNNECTLSAKYDDILKTESDNYTKPVYLHTRHVKLNDRTLYKCIAKVTRNYDYLFNGDLVQVNKIENNTAYIYVLYNNKYMTIDINFLKPVSFRNSINYLEKDIFKNHYKHLNNSNGFEVEFKSLSNDLPDDELGLFNKNMNKNRDRNIKLTTDTRYKFTPTEKKLLNANDYIHANLVLNNTHELCIVTQAPMKDTIVDFWNMILADGSNLIVMLTNFKEDGKDKCVEYFPSSLNEIIKINELIEVKCTEMVYMQNWTRRKLCVTGKDVEYELWHYHCRFWPGPRIETACLLFTEYFEDIKLLRDYKKIGELRPVIHCSAGVDRSGTFVAISALLKWKEIPHHEINIKGLVALLRTERYGMVQDIDQYKMIYNVLNHIIDMRF